MQPSGKGFPTFLEDVLRADREAFASMERDFAVRFPEYRVELLKGNGQNEIWFRTPEGHDFPAASVSDGTVMYLAYMAVANQPDPPDILLVEEPENGVHFQSLRDVVAALRRIADQKGVQVVMATHSPYLLDLVEPEEVRVFSKDEEGAVHQRRLSDHPEVQSLKKHFMTGEIWTELGDTEVAEQGGASR